MAAAAEELALREAEEMAELSEAEIELAEAEAELIREDMADEAELRAELALALALDIRLDPDALKELSDAVAEAVADAVEAPETAKPAEKLTKLFVPALAMPKLYWPLDEAWTELGIVKVAVPVLPSML